MNNKTKTILAIGNSFSDDAFGYFYQMAEADGVKIKTVNLYIGGCSLEQHCHNIDTGEACYEYHLNGCDTGRMISVKEALQEEDWDYISIQQASHDSGILESYYPYTEKLLNYVREYCENSTILLHQTWAYEIDSDHGMFGRYDHDQKKMYDALKECYGQIQKEFHLTMIPSGDLIQRLRETAAFDYGNGEPSLCRDGFHMSFTYGRYALAMLWYKLLCNGDIEKNSFLPEVDGGTFAEDKLRTIREMVKEISNHG